ncbi:MAG: HDIG domain-containing protein [Bacteroidota bacterium]|nr:HDIG domain-containing protein [Bacteroidota bacterium]
MSLLTKIRRVLRLNRVPEGRWFRIVVLAALVSLTALAFYHENVREFAVEEGEMWSGRTIQAPFDFPLRKSEDSLRAERARVRQTVEPIFYRVPDAAGRMQRNHDVVGRELDLVFARYANYLMRAKRDSLAVSEEEGPVRLSPTTVQDSLAYLEARQGVTVRFTEDQWRWLGWDYAQRLPSMPDAQRGDFAPAPPMYESILEAVYTRSGRLQAGVLSIPIDSIHTREISLRDTTDSSFEIVSKSELIGLNALYERISDYAEDYLSLDTAERLNVGEQLLAAIFVPGLEYQRASTELLWQEAEAGISEVRGMVSQGEEIVRRGEQVSAETRQKLQSLATTRLEFQRTGDSRLIVSELISWRTLGKILIALATFMVFCLYLLMARPAVVRDNNLVLLIGLVYAGVILLFYAAVREDPDFLYVVPVVVASVLFTIVFDSRVGLVGTLTLALIGGLILDFDFQYTYATLAAGGCAVYSVRDIRNRGQLFYSAGFALVGYGIVLASFWLLDYSSTLTLGKYAVLVGISSFLLVTTYPFLWVLERLFGITTDLRLMELADTNQPLLKLLSNQAPGTFNHAVQVSNIAETVAETLGANALLARLGGLYHDIGKSYKPEAFTENQRGGINLHDQLTPRLSARLIIAHVEEGVKLGREHELPRPIIDLIATHHGTTTTAYFYHKAKSAKREGAEPVNADDFRYPGPRPQTKEAAILMLTDSTEAASRSLQTQDEKTLRSLIDNIVAARIREGELDDCGLTFRDIRLIKATLLKQLCAIYYIRPEYPDQRPPRSK